MMTASNSQRRCKDLIQVMFVKLHFTALCKYILETIRSINIYIHFKDVDQKYYSRVYPVAKYIRDQ